MTKEHEILVPYARLKHKYQSLEFVDMNKVILGINTCLAYQNKTAIGEGLNSFETMIEESAQPIESTKEMIDFLASVGQALKIAAGLTNNK